MPYNNTPIAPSKDVRGEVSLPLSRVQKIINADPERTHVSKNAAFAIAMATEMFIQHLATTTHNVVKAERKPRRNIQYRDVATAVSKTDNLEFLVDVVPKTVTYGEYKKSRVAIEKQKNKAKASAAEAEVDAERERGDGPFGHRYADIRAMFAKNDDEKTEGEKSNGHSQQNGEGKVDGPVGMDLDDDEATEDEEPDAAAMQIEMEMRGGRRASTVNGSSPAHQRRSSGFTAVNNGK